MWMFALPVTLLVVFGFVHLLRVRRFRHRERAMVDGDLHAFLRVSADPQTRPELAFTGPHRFDEDRAHDTMFSVRHGSRLLSFILDTSRARIRWWALDEWFGPDGKRSARFETTFSEGTNESSIIRCLLVAARLRAEGAQVTAPAPPETSPPPETPTAEPPKDPPVDPFEAASEPAAQA